MNSTFKVRFDTPAREYSLSVTKFICNRFGLAEFFARHVSSLGTLDSVTLDSVTLDGATVLDVGCGAGSLSIFLADQFGCNVFAVDLNPQAVACCRDNVIEYGLDAQIKVQHGDFAEISAALDNASFDLIVSNPPLSTRQTTRPSQAKVLDEELYRFLTNEWRDASGRDLVDHILDAGTRLLTPDGAIVLVCCDIDAPSVEYVHAKAEQYGYHCQVRASGSITASALGITSKLIDSVDAHVFRLLRS